MSNDIAISVENLTKQYGDLMAVNDISFDVKRGEIFAFLGPNGAGKTTTVEILVGLRKPTSGRAHVLGFDIAKDQKEIKKRIGVLPQSFNTDGHSVHRCGVVDNQVGGRLTPPYASL